MTSALRLSVILLALALSTLLSGQQANAASAAHVTGGGTGTFGADLDGDGDIEASQFGFGAVVYADGSATGHFNCLMAGRSDILGLGLMAVEGKITSGSVNGNTATLSGTASVLLTRSTLPGVPEGKFTLPFTVTVTAGGPGAGGMSLSVIGAFDGAPGDVVAANGNYDLAVETVRSGGIRIR